MNLSVLPYRVDIPYSQGIAIIAEDWIRKNINGLYYHDNAVTDLDDLSIEKFYFQNSLDAAFFKLQFG